MHQITLTHTPEGIEFAFLLNGEEVSFEQLTPEQRKPYLNMIIRFSTYFAPAIEATLAMLN